MFPEKSLPSCINVFDFIMNFNLGKECNLKFRYKYTDIKIFYEKNTVTINHGMNTINMRKSAMFDGISKFNQMDGKNAEDLMRCLLPAHVREKM